MHEIAQVTKCTLCGRSFYGAGVHIIGQSQNARLAQFVGKLWEHVHDEHKEAFQTVMACTEEFRGLGLLMLYQSTDQELTKQREFLRWSTHQRTIATRVTDEMLDGHACDLAQRLEQEVATIVLDDPRAVLDDTDGTHFEKVLGALLRDKIKQLLLAETKALRDTLEEPAVSSSKRGPTNRPPKTCQRSNIKPQNRQF